MHSRLKVIYTGGTLGMVSSPQGLVPASKLSERLNEVVDATPALRLQLADISWSIMEKRPLLDSANVTPFDWEIIANDCLSASNVDAIVIIHGTDTLAFTASALAFLLSDIAIPVITTGSQLPLGAENSDALDNLFGAMRISIKTRPGVWVFFNQKLMPACRVVKRSTLSLDGFDAPRVDNNFENMFMPHQLKWHKRARDWNDFHIPVVYFTPGYQASSFSALLATKPCAMILVLYGSGTMDDMNSSLLDAIMEAEQQSTLLVAVTQCYVGSIDFAKYAAGARLAKLDVLPGHDMTLEAAYTKLMVLFRRGYSTGEIRSLFEQSLVGELTDGA